VIDVVAVDWSGARTGAARHIWLAHARNGEIIELANGRDRRTLTAYLINLKTTCPDGLAVGLDFSFSFPAWFLQAQGHAEVRALWRQAAAAGETWLANCEPPFWGKPGHRRPQLEGRLRRTEEEASVDGISAKSSFQIGGAGTVGTGSVRGMPYLLELQSAGFSIWPFDPPSRWVVVELYPRLCTGPVAKSNVGARVDYLRRHGWNLTDEHTALATASEDAFDAAISALVMDLHRDDLSRLTQSSDPVTLREGMIWRPPSIGP
jgi:hypothetical protein